MHQDYNFAPPPINNSTMSPRRRQHDHQPPALSTTLSAIHRFGSHLAGHTPVSATTLSSPFNPANYTASPGAASPHPNAGTPSGSYNPQQWSANGVSSPAAGPRYVPHHSLNATAARAVGAAGGPAEGDPPPPPYSPRRPGQAHPTAAVSPADEVVSPAPTVSSATSSSRYNTPTSAATTISPLGSSYQTITTTTITTSPQQAAQSSPHHPASGSYSTTQTLPPPPPPTAEQRARSASRSRSDHPRPVVGTQGQTGSGGRVQQPFLEDGHALEESSRRANAFDPSNAAFEHQSGMPRSNDTVRPPASRRAASTGAIGMSYTPARLHDENTSPGSSEWRPGMPLPPPPPGPPPASRSQSMNRSLGSSSRNFSSPVSASSQPTRRPTTNGSRLPPVPPTPSDWVDEEREQAFAENARVNHARRLQLDTSEAVTANVPAEGPGLVRSAAVRDRSAKGIRERRSESRTGKGRMTEAYTAIEPSNNPWADELEDDNHVKPADLVLPTESGMIRRRRTVTKSTPRSARSFGTAEGVPGSASSMSSTAPPDSASTRHITPRPGSARQTMSPAYHESTSAGLGMRESPHAIPPKSLPTPPPQNHLLDVHQQANGRPLSHILHTPNSDATMPPPLMPLRPPSQSSGRSSVDVPPVDVFTQAAIERHNQFAKRESAANTDRERVQIFATFIVAESRIRRDRYAGAIDAMGSEILELTRDLFRPADVKTPALASPSSLASRSVGASPSSAGSEWSSHRGSLNLAMNETFTPAESPKTRPESGWAAATYMPSLSPIPSMSVSEVPDELSSRGRPSSRWWEASQEGSIYGGGTRGLERSKRESKYMGLPLREWDLASSSGNSTSAGPSTAQTVEYPPEKVGWHEESTPQTSDPKKLDVSRLVTLPPPYPRHYPAVNNNHPDLTAIRTVVRGLNDLSHVASTRESFNLEISELAGSDRKRRSQLREDIRRQIEADSMSYAEAARLEEAEEKAGKDRFKREFEKFQTDVMTPLHALLTERISLATDSIAALKGQLLGASDANPMEEGDEQPELLEKLTLLKWLFEAREQLHREAYELLSERNTRYKQMVVAPYDDAAKIQDVEAFFAKDGDERRAAFEKEALARCETFMDVVEENVTKGVEIQLSAFWDIAPSLMDVVGRINVARGVQTDGERDYAFSQQYLWEVLCHAEKSAYQFIEGQINLLCLLHEVKSGVAKQRVKVAEVDRATPTVQEEEDRLTRDLQEKVSTVEKQWAEAMGERVDEVKARVKAWLARNGGWEGMEEDD